MSRRRPTMLLAHPKRLSSLAVSGRQTQAVGRRHDGSPCTA